MHTNDAQPRICSFESRRQPEMSRLLARFGATGTVAPSMREIPLTDNQDAIAFGEELLAGRVDLMVFLTGVGARALMECLESRHERFEILTALRRTETAIRGPKPAAVLREWDVPITYSAPSPNTHIELLRTLRDEAVLAGKSIAVQEYGRPNPELYAGLTESGATVRPIPVYRWALPEDTGPLRDTIESACEDAFDAYVFTAAKQIEHVLEVAAETGRREAFLAAAGRAVVGSVGPECTIGLNAAGLTPDIEATPPKMGPLVRATVEAVRGRSATSNQGPSAGSQR